MVRRILFSALVLLALAGPGAPADAKATQGQWITRCFYDHSLPDDPIVHFGAPGMSHLHAFLGARGTDAFTTFESLMAAPSGCKDAHEHSAYWIPQLLDADGNEVHPSDLVNYWSGIGEPVPQGMQFIVGSAALEGPQAHVSWQCERLASVQQKAPTLDHPFDCTSYGSEAVARFELPTCWTGAGVTPDQFAYKPCPAGFSHIIVHTEVRVRLGVLNPLPLHLSSGSLGTMHMDFFNAWTDGRQEDLIAKCIAVGVNCGTVTTGRP